MSATINGVVVRWSMPNFTFGSALGTIQLQSYSHEKTDEPETIKDRLGQTVSRIWPDPSRTATFEGFVYDGTNVAGAKNQTKIPACGAFIVISYSASEHGEFASTSVTAEVISSKDEGTNTSAIKLTMTVKIWPATALAAGTTTTIS